MVPITAERSLYKCRKSSSFIWRNNLRNFGQYTTSVWVQLCEVPYKFYQELLTTYPRKWSRYWKDSYKKTNQLVSFKIRIFQLLDILSFTRGATNFDSFLKAYRILGTKGFFQYEWFNHPDKLNNKELPPSEAFHKLQKRNLPEKGYPDNEKVIVGGLATDSALAKTKFSEIQRTGTEKYLFLKKMWEKKNAVIQNIFALVQ